MRELNRAVMGSISTEVLGKAAGGQVFPREESGHRAEKALGVVWYERMGVPRGGGLWRRQRKHD